MVTAVKEAPAPAGEYQLAPIGIIQVDKGFNNRRSLGNIDELTESIQSVGVLQPLLVWKRELGLQSDPAVKGKGFLHVIAGHRRLAAASQAGLSHVPVIIVEQDEKLRLESLLVENLHRLDLDPLEEAEGYKRLLALGLKQQDISAKVGRSPAHVSKRLSLLELPRKVHDLVVAGKLTIVDALELVPYVGEPEIVKQTMQQVEESIAKGWHFEVGRQAAAIKARIEQDRKRNREIEKLRQANVTILKTNQWGEPEKSRGITILGDGYGRLKVDVAVHAKEPCHVAWVNQYGEVRYGCTKVASHKKSKVPELAKAAKRLTADRSSSSTRTLRPKLDPKEVARKEAAAARTAARLPVLKKLITGRQKRDVVLDFTLRQLLQLILDMDEGSAAIAAELVGMQLPPAKGKWDRPMPDFASWISGGKDRVFTLAYALAIAAGEEPLRGDGFGATVNENSAVRLIAHLKANGYRPDKVELVDGKGVRGMPAWDIKKAKRK